MDSILAPVKLLYERGILHVNGSNLSKSPFPNILSLLYNDNMMNNKIINIVTRFIPEDDYKLYPHSSDEIIIVYNDLIGIYSLKNDNIIKFIYPYTIRDHLYYHNEYNGDSYIFILYARSFIVLDISKRQSLYFEIHNRDIIPYGYNSYRVSNIENDLYIFISDNKDTEIYKYNDDGITRVSHIRSNFNKIRDFHVLTFNNKLAIIMEEEYYETMIIMDADGKIILTITDIDIINEIYIIRDTIYFFNRAEIVIRELEHINFDKNIVNFEEVTTEIFRGDINEAVTIELLSSYLLLFITKTEMKIYNLKKNNVLIVIETQGDVNDIIVLSEYQIIYKSVLYTINYHNGTVQETKFNLGKLLFKFPHDKESYKHIKGVNIPFISNNVKNIILRFI